MNALAVPGGSFGDEVSRRLCEEGWRNLVGLLVTATTRERSGGVESTIGQRRGGMRFNFFLAEVWVTHDTQVRGSGSRLTARAIPGGPPAHYYDLPTRLALGGSID